MRVNHRLCALEDNEETDPSSPILWLFLLAHNRASYNSLRVPLEHPDLPCRKKRKCLKFQLFQNLCFNNMNGFLETRVKTEHGLPGGKLTATGLTSAASAVTQSWRRFFFKKKKHKVTQTLDLRKQQAGLSGCRSTDNSLCLLSCRAETRELRRLFSAVSRVWSQQVHREEILTKGSINSRLLWGHGTTLPGLL